MSDLQFIFVDDGSTDVSMEIVRSVLLDYPERIPQTLMLSFPSNLGVSAARQIGLEHAEGQYVIHCDSDDWVERETYQTLYDKALSMDADIVTCGYYIERSSRFDKVAIPAASDKDIRSFSISPRIGSLCLKLVRRDLIVQNQLRMPQQVNWGEDLCFSVQAFLVASNVQSVDQSLYHYVNHAGSITQALTFERCAELIRCGYIIEQFLIGRHLEREYAFSLFWLKFQLKQFYLMNPATRDFHLWLTTFPECHEYILRYDCAFYLKLVAWLLLHHCQLLASGVLFLRDEINDCKKRWL